MDFIAGRIERHKQMGTAASRQRQGRGPFAQVCVSRAKTIKPEPRIPLNARTFGSGKQFSLRCFQTGTERSVKERR
jgi:hypothetical protein